MSKTIPPASKSVFSVSGMHCASCELLIEKKISEEFGTVNANASTANGMVSFEHGNKNVSASELNLLFKEEGYRFTESDRDTGNNASSTADTSLLKFMLILGLLLLIIVAVGLLRSGILSSFTSVDTATSIPAFFLFGLIAGVSSCAALVGGFLLSLSKQWNEQYGGLAKQRAYPHILFNVGRLGAFFILGGVLGTIGSVFKASAYANTVISVIVAAIMILLALQMLGIKQLQRFQIRLPKPISHKILSGSSSKNDASPLLLGVFTFFLPCGFTIAAQTVALASGNFLTGALIMFLFALGTLPMLITVGFTSAQLISRPRLSSVFTKAAGILVLFFALYTINAQLNVLGVRSATDIFNPATTSPSNTSSTPTGNIQVIRMNASAGSFEPNSFSVKAGIPVRWEVSDSGFSGCTSSVIANGLFDGSFKFSKNKTAIKEFTPTKPGTYKFSCWMGMVTGTITVVENDALVNLEGAQSSQSGTPSSSGGCGCGGGAAQ